jgi:hypothetical protein
MGRKKEVWSFSRLSTADDCLYSFWSQYIALEEQEQNGWGLGGSYTHEIIERCLRGDIPFGQEAADIWLNGLPVLKFPKMTSDYIGTYVEQSYNFIKNFKGVNNEIVAIERKFEIKLKPGWLRGFIDLETRTEQGDLIITDWKSSAKSGFVGKKLAQKARQLYLYAESCKIKYGEYPKEMYFYLYREKLPIKIVWNKQDAKEAIEWMGKVVAKVKESTDFPPKTKADFFCNNICGTKSCIHK